jgi:hypothetical protein
MHLLTQNCSYISIYAFNIQRLIRWRDIGLSEKYRRSKALLQDVEGISERRVALGDNGDALPEASGITAPET